MVLGSQGKGATWEPGLPNCISTHQTKNGKNMAFLMGENKPRTWIQIAVISGVLAIPLVSLSGNKQSTATATQVSPASQAQKKVVLKNLGMV